VPRLAARLARLERCDVGNSAATALCCAWLAPIASNPVSVPDVFPPRLASHLLAELARPRTRGNAVAFLDALADFGRGGGPSRA
jgi:hypothetical protein